MSVFAELELGIGGLDTLEAEEHLAHVLKNLNGVHSVRLVKGAGAHVIYNSVGITPEEIITTVRQAGFALDTHQKTGEL